MEQGKLRNDEGKRREGGRQRYLDGIGAERARGRRDEKVTREEKLTHMSNISPYERYQRQIGRGVRY